MKTEVIVIGGGHAGAEAAAAASRMGCDTVLVTQSLDSIGRMSCNPSIGGIGKSHLAREVDALDGLMASCAERSAIHLRVLNSSKGPAVRATRAQADRGLYAAAMRGMLRHPRLRLLEAEAADLIVRSGMVCGLVTAAGERIEARALVIASGTFLGGLICRGDTVIAGGRAGDAPANLLAQRLRATSLRVSRLKTGTPPRLRKDSVDLDSLEQQWGDEPRPLMSFLGERSQHPRQLCCWVAHTNEHTHRIIRDNLQLSALYGGAISSRGPRYCPSVEDKVVRFADRASHQVFVEPEGLTSDELYPNGLSTSLPERVQLDFIRSIKGMESARISRPGYAIEYDFFDPRDLHLSLESRLIGNLFMAGQINGTTGYEEAASQGLLAGANAALRARERDPWVPSRGESYIGVMVDDLCTLGVEEPYRMFTSRAEYRLLLREDNADARLTETGRRLGLVGERRWRAFCDKRERMEREMARLHDTRVRPGDDRFRHLNLREPCSMASLLCRPEVRYADLAGERVLRDDEALSLEWSVKYQGYIRRQGEEIARLEQRRGELIPDGFDYSSLAGLSAEALQALESVRPQSLDQASRVPGVTCAALSIIHLALRRKRAA